MTALFPPYLWTTSANDCSIRGYAGKEITVLQYKERGGRGDREAKEKVFDIDQIKKSCNSILYCVMKWYTHIYWLKINEITTKNNWLSSKQSKARIWYVLSFCQNEKGFFSWELQTIIEPVKRK